MFKYTSHTLKKIEAVFKEGGYSVRYEKGHFRSGYCLLESKKVVVINRYYSLESKINSLLDILQEVTLDRSGLSDSSRKIYKEATSQKIES